MSLTKDEWCQVWQSIKKLEYLIEKEWWKVYQIKKEIDFLKNKVQSVIGSME